MTTEIKVTLFMTFMQFVIAVNCVTVKYIILIRIYPTLLNILFLILNFNIKVCYLVIHSKVLGKKNINLAFCQPKQKKTLTFENNSKRMTTRKT